jgi:hypothetical protein
MTAPLTETTLALSKVQGSKTIKLSQEGIIAGTWCCDRYLWFLLLDVLTGPSLYTPYARYGAFQRWERAMSSAHVELSLGMVGAFTTLHWLTFELIWCPRLVAPGTGRA